MTSIASWARHCTLGLFLALALGGSATAAVVVSNPGPVTSGFGNRVLASPWSQTSAYDNVSVSGSFFGLGQSGVTARAWLTTAIGGSATEADVVAQTDITSDLLFSAVDLAADPYYSPGTAALVSLALGALLLRPGRRQAC